MLSLIPLLLPVLTTPVVSQDEGLILHEPTTGVTVTVPDDWTLAKGDEGLMAVSEDTQGFVLLAASKEDFEEVREDIKALILMRLDDVVITTSTVEGLDQRGAIEELVAASGTGISRRDGEAVEFSGLLVRSGESGALALGAWKNAANEKAVAGILASLEVKQSSGKEGLEITNSGTGVSVKIPAAWEVVRSRKGLLTTAPEGKAMVVLMRWQGDFEAQLKGMRAKLLTWVFKDVEIGDFSIVEAAYDKSLGQVIAANGTAVDRLDDKPLEFTAVRIQNLDKDEGAALFGAWKDEEHAKQVAALLASIKLQKKAMEKR